MHNQHDASYDSPQEQPYRAGILHTKEKKFSLAIYPKFKKESKKKEIICENKF